MQYLKLLLFCNAMSALVVQFLEFLKLITILEINYNNIPVDMLGYHNEKLEESET